MSLSEQTLFFATRKLRLLETLVLGNGMQGDEIMLGLIAAVLIICWLLGLFAFHISAGLFHVLLVVGLVLLVMHFVTGRRATI
jgi:hypothetical protein